MACIICAVQTIQRQNFPWVFEIIAPFIDLFLFTFHIYKYDFIFLNSTWIVVPSSFDTHCLHLNVNKK